VQGGGFLPINMRAERKHGVEKDSLGDSLENTGLKTGLNDFLGRF
jgi:hypothetical protein